MKRDMQICVFFFSLPVFKKCYYFILKQEASEQKLMDQWCVIKDPSPQLLRSRFYDQRLGVRNLNNTVFKIAGFTK